MYKNTLLIAAILVVSTNCQQKISKGCVTRGSLGFCDACYRRQITNDGNCGPLLPVTDNCLIHLEYQGESTNCSQCRPGYGQGAQAKCYVVDIFNCIHGGISFGGYKKCLICGNNQFPDPYGATCVPTSSINIKNCLWGNGLNLCEKCVPGYAVSSGGHSCVPWTSETQRCWLLAKGNQKCNWCDVFGEYSMQKSKKCLFVKQE